MLEQLPLILTAGIILVVFFLLGITCHRIKIPVILALIILGIGVNNLFAGKAVVLNYVAEIGIILLFFLLGLEFPINKMITISKRVWPAGLMDIGLNFGIGCFIAVLFGLEWVQALIVGGIAYASSSSITIKMLEDKKRLAAPESDFILALLIFEDLVAPVMVSFLSSIYIGTAVSIQGVSVFALKMVLLIAGAIFIGYFGFRKIGDFVEKYHGTDIMPLFGIGIALSYAGFAIALGLSEVLGAFLAGVMLSETGSSKELDHDILPIRNLFLPFFFFWFGTTLSFNEGVPMLFILVVLVIWSTISKILVGLLGGRLFGLEPHRALRAGFSLIQRGEFSIIIAAIASPQIRSFSGAYILSTAFIGIIFFNKAPNWSKWINDKYFKKN